MPEHGLGRERKIRQEACVLKACSARFRYPIEFLRFFKWPRFTRIANEHVVLGSQIDFAYVVSRQFDIKDVLPSSGKNVAD